MIDYDLLHVPQLDGILYLEAACDQGLWFRGARHVLLLLPLHLLHKVHLLHRVDLLDLPRVAELCLQGCATLGRSLFSTTVLKDLFAILPYCPGHSEKCEDFLKIYLPMPLCRI
jgi:hypothetical protein